MIDILKDTLSKQPGLYIEQKQQYLTMLKLAVQQDLSSFSKPTQKDITTQLSEISKIMNLSLDQKAHLTKRRLGFWTLRLPSNVRAKIHQRLIQLATSIPNDDPNKNFKHQTLEALAQELLEAPKPHKEPNRPASDNGFPPQGKPKLPILPTDDSFVGFSRELSAIADTLLSTQPPTQQPATAKDTSTLLPEEDLLSLLDSQYANTSLTSTKDGLSAKVVQDNATSQKPSTTGEGQYNSLDGKILEAFLDEIEHLASDPAAYMTLENLLNDYRTAVGKGNGTYQSMREALSKQIEGPAKGAVPRPKKPR